MFREYRWQMAALVVTALIFFAVLLTGTGDDGRTEPPQPSPTATAQNTPQPTPTEVVVAQPTVAATPQVVTPQPQPEAEIAPRADDVPTYREALVGEVGRLNPLFASLNPVDADITELIFEGLTTVDQFGDIAPLLAEEWAVSSDGYNYVFSLRRDVLWQDGQPFSVDDVLYTFSLLQSPDFPVVDELREFWKTVEMERIDDHTIRFRLAQPLAIFPAVLRVGILPEHALRGTQADQIAAHPFNLSPIGTGPYQLEALRAVDGIIRAVDLRVAPNHRARPDGADGYAVERVTFRLYDTFDDVLDALRDGEVDGYAGRQRDERRPLQSLQSVEIHQTLSNDIGFLIFNWANDELFFLRDDRFRIALSYGLNRAPLIDRALYDQAVRADSPIPRLSWAYSYGESLGASWRYLPDRASDEMAAARERYIEPEDSPISEFAFDLLTPDDPALVALAGEIAAQWEVLDVIVRVVAEDEADYIERLQAGDFGAALVELSKAGNADPDVYAFWHEGQHPDGKNYGGVDSLTISEALESARRDPVGTHRRIHYDNFQREFINRAVAIPLYAPLFTYAVAPHIVDVQIGFIGAPPDRFVTIQDWRIETP
ncbi:MAG: hypothetical protein EA396_14810 [Anaerolineaceae bacterium]|nr:MAG: hypothetical protein EA396_14810 [Anaerolineaceae bacterium]